MFCGTFGKSKIYRYVRIHGAKLPSSSCPVDPFSIRIALSYVFMTLFNLFHSFPDFLLLHSPAGIKLVILALLLDEFVMGAALDDAALL